MRNKLKIFAVLAIILTGFIASGSAASYDLKTCSDLDPLPSSSSGDTLNVKNDIDCNGQTITPSTGGFEATLKGNSYTLSNFYIKESGNSGFVESLESGATIENLIFKNITNEPSSSPGHVGIVSGDYNGGTYDNIQIIDSKIITSGGYNGALFGRADTGSGTAKEIQVKNFEITGSLNEAGSLAGRVDAGITFNQTIIENIDLSSVSPSSGAIGSTFGGYPSLYNLRLVNVTAGNGFIRYQDGGSIVDGMIGGSDTSISNNNVCSTCNSFSDVYYDTTETSISDGSATGLSNSDMIGSSASNNMNFNFNDIWTTVSNYYPDLLFSIEPKVDSIESPSDGAKIGKGYSQDFNWTVSSGGSSATVELKITYPNGSTITEFSDSLSSQTTKSYSKTKTFNDSGDYNFTIDVGSDSVTRSFEVIDYSKPSFNLISPKDSETINTFSDPYNQDFKFSVDSDINGTYELQSKVQSNANFNTLKTGSIDKGNNTYNPQGEINLSTDSEDRDWRVKVTDEIDSNTSYSEKFTVQLNDPPNISLETPENNDLYWIENGGTVDIPFKGWVNSSAEEGDAFARAVKFRSPPDSDVNYVLDLGEISKNSNEFFTGNLTVGTTGTHNNGRIDADLDGGNTFSSNNVSFDVKNANPQITSFNVRPSDFKNIQPGEYFNVSVEGDVYRDSIDRIEYDIDVNQQDKDSFTKKPIDYQDQNRFLDSEDNLFEMKQTYQGKDIDITAEVFDTQGLSDTQIVSGTTATPPDHFILNSPNDGQIFLIPQSKSNYELTYDYGVDTAENGGTAYLVVNGNDKDSFSISAKSQNTQQFTENLTEGSYSYKVRFNDSTDQETYTSNSKSFQVTDEPVSIVLNGPSGQITKGSNPIDVRHNFTLDAQATPSQIYYKFRLNNSDTNTLLESRTSSDMDIDTKSFTEKVNSLSDGNYSWDVRAYRASDDKLLESKSTSYEIVSNPLFSQSIDSPINNSNFYVDNQGDVLDVTGTYNVQAFKSQVSSSVFLDNGLINSSTTSTSTSTSHDFLAQGLSTGSYKVKLESKDGNGRTQEDTVNFDVEVQKPQDVEITSIRTEPSIEEAKAGDELDVYIEGEGNVSKVDFLQVEVKVDGEVKETILVDTDNLQSGSWYCGPADCPSLKDAVTVAADWIGKGMKIVGEAISDAGERTSTFISNTVGSESSLGVSLNNPKDGYVYTQPQGNSDQIRFEFDITTDSNPVDYYLYIRPNGSATYQQMPGGVKTGSVSKTDSTVNVEEFRNMDTNILIQQQFGKFDWKVRVEDSAAGKNVTAGPKTFSIKQPQNVTLNFKNPSDGDPIYINNPRESTDVPFSYEIDTTEEGKVRLDIDDTQVYSRDVNSGLSQDSFTKDLPTGVYTANLSFESSNLRKHKEITFSIEKNDPEPQNPKISLIEPRNNSTLYQDIKGQSVGRKFGWSVFNPAEDNEIGEGNTTLYIEDSNNNIVESFERNYTTQNSRKIFNQLYKVDLNIGEYDFYAEFDAPNRANTISSNTRSFKVKDFNPPSVTGVGPINQTITTEENPEFRFSVESFEQSPEVELRLREKGEFKSDVIFSSSQVSDTIRTYTYNGSKLNEGTYEWFVRNKINPTFDSQVYTFTVEPDSIKEPEFNLRNPDQDQIIEYNSSRNNASVLFDYEVTGFSEKDANVDLRLQRVNENAADGNFKTLESNKQNLNDGKERYNYNEALNESGYRYRVRVKYPNGQKETSKTKSFVVDSLNTTETPSVPNPDPQSTGIFERGAELLGSINASYKAAVGSSGQFMTATLILLLISGGFQLAFRMDYLTIISAVLLTVGFSLLDGYYPLETFWIVLGVSAGLASWVGLKAFSGGDS